MSESQKIKHKNINCSLLADQLFFKMDSFWLLNKDNCSSCHRHSAPTGLEVALHLPSLVACPAPFHQPHICQHLEPRPQVGRQRAHWSTGVGTAGGANQTRGEKKKEEERRSISHSVFPIDSGLGRQPKLNGPASGQQMAPCQLPFSALASQPIVKKKKKNRILKRIIASSP